MVDEAVFSYFKQTSNNSDQNEGSDLSAEQRKFSKILLSEASWTSCVDRQFQHEIDPKPPPSLRRVEKAF